MDKKAASFTRRYDYALRMYGRTGDPKYKYVMERMEQNAAKKGYVGRMARNSRGNNKMFRFMRL